MTRYRHGSNILFFACLFAACLLQGCHRLPSDFSSRSLDEKVSIYERHFEEGGRQRMEATSWISWHGLPAANIMALYLTDKKHGIPKREAIEIIWAIQRRGCSLRGTASQNAIEFYLAAKPAPSPFEKELASTALDYIVHDRHSANYDTLPPGPCNAQ